jgi:hypothetical protein
MDILILRAEFWSLLDLGQVDFHKSTVGLVWLCRGRTRHLAGSNLCGAPISVLIIKDM